MIVICDGCYASFERKQGEVNRSLRLNRKQYCCRNCSGRNTPLVTRPNDFPRGSGNPGNRLDEFSPFRSHYGRIKRRDWPVTITLQDLKTIWDNQNGICPLTGCPMILAETSKWDGTLITPMNASLDRIDNDQGYLLGNVRWVSAMANLARNRWDDAAVIGWARLVTDHHKNISASTLAAEPYRFGSK